MNKIILQVIIILIAGAGIYYCVTKLFTGYDSELGGGYQVKVVALEANNEQAATISYRLAAKSKGKPSYEVGALPPVLLTPEMTELAPAWYEITLFSTRLQNIPAADFETGPIAAPSEKEKIGILTYMILAEAGEEQLRFYAGFSEIPELTKEEFSKTNLTLTFTLPVPK